MATVSVLYEAARSRRTPSAQLTYRHIKTTLTPRRRDCEPDVRSEIHGPGIDQRVADLFFQARKIGVRLRNTGGASGLRYRRSGHHRASIGGSEPIAGGAAREAG